MYPLADHIDFHKNDKVDTLWFDLLTYDVAYLHSVVFLCQSYSSLVSGIQAPASAYRGMVHYSEALRLLRERISGQSKERETWNSTILVVLYLATHAHLVGDISSAKHHLQGLRKMTDLKGGIYAFGYNPKLIIELMKDVTRGRSFTAAGRVKHLLHGPATSLDGDDKILLGDQLCNKARASAS
ncbi:unnamed protein product [Penicillium pancosmium]